MRDIEVEPDISLASYFSIHQDRAAAIRERVGRESGVVTDPLLYWQHARMFARFEALNRREADYALCFAGYLFAIADMQLLRGFCEGMSDFPDYGDVEPK